MAGDGNTTKIGFDWKTLLTIGLTVVAAAALITGDPLNGDDDSPSSDSDAAFLGDKEGPPREYVYLDNARVETYLSQLTDGLANQAKLSRSVSEKRTAELSASPAKIGRDLSTAQAYERTVTPTASSRLFNLRQILFDRGLLRELPSVDRPASRPCGKHPRAETFLEDWREVREGDFVRVQAYLRLPPYARLYHTLRQAPPNSDLGAAGKPLVDAVGPDPRFSFSVCVPTGEDEPLRLIFPAQYALFATEPSLFQGELNFVGKVLFRLDGDGATLYRDVQTYQRFRPSLELADDKLLRRLGIAGRDALRRDLLGYYTIRAPAAVVMPIAIYK